MKTIVNNVESPKYQKALMNKIIKRSEKAWDKLRDARSAFNDQKAYLEGQDLWADWCKSRGFSLDCNFEDCGA